jgi:hypothetical protein
MHDLREDANYYQTNKTKARISKIVSYSIKSMLDEGRRAVERDAVFEKSRQDNRASRIELFATLAKNLQASTNHEDYHRLERWLNNNPPP